ncbi:hypothetical protein GCM10027074_69350 [Streptomyces deserti]
MNDQQEPRFRVRARHTASTVTVYQAYRPEIGRAAARAGRFPSSWKRDRMTWIKPSFLWMMYRCGWGTKQDQETVLAIEIRREGFVRALRDACLSHYVPALHGDEAAWKRRLRQAPARVQWDPERDLHLNPLPHRSLQLARGGGGGPLRRRVDRRHRGRHAPGHADPRAGMGGRTRPCRRAVARGAAVSARRGRARAPAHSGGSVSCRGRRR